MDKLRDESDEPEADEPEAAGQRSRWTRRRVLSTFAKVMAGTAVGAPVVNALWARRWGYLDHAPDINGSYAIVCGDSLAGGVGAGHYDDRTTNYYTGDFSSNLAAGVLVAQRKGWGYTNIARSGVRSQQFEESQLPQIEEIIRVHGLPKEITLSLGGNQKGVSLPDGLAKALFHGDYVHSESDAFKAGLPHVQEDVYSTLLKLKAVAPDTPIFMLGMPNLFGRFMNQKDGMMSPDNKRGLHDAAWLINREVRMACMRAGVTFVDLWTSLAGHEAGSEDPYVVDMSPLEMGLDAIDVAIRQVGKDRSRWAPWHPSAEAQPIFADHLEAAIDAQCLVSERGGLGLCG